MNSWGPLTHRLSHKHFVALHILLSILAISTVEILAVRNVSMTSNPAILKVLPNRFLVFNTFFIDIEALDRAMDSLTDINGLRILV